MANLLLIMTQEISLKQKRVQIQQMINSAYDNEIEMNKLNNAIKCLSEYTVFGDQLKELLFFDSLDSILKQTEKEVNIVLKRLQS